jgi:hypothetical protein
MQKGLLLVALIASVSLIGCGGAVQGSGPEHDAQGDAALDGGDSDAAQGGPGDVTDVDSMPLDATLEVSLPEASDDAPGSDDAPTVFMPGDGAEVDPGCAGLWDAGFAAGSRTCFLVQADADSMGGTLCVPPDPKGTDPYALQGWEDQLFGCAVSDGSVCPPSLTARHGAFCCGTGSSTGGPRCASTRWARSFEYGWVMDSDLDLVWDIEDNCPYVENGFTLPPTSAFQRDSDNDGIGDVCDNCPFVFNPNQQPADCDDAGVIAIATLDAGLVIDPGCDAMPTNTFVPGQAGACFRLSLAADAGPSTSMCFPSLSMGAEVVACSADGEPCPSYDMGYGPARHGSHCCDLVGYALSETTCLPFGTSRFAVAEPKQFLDSDGDGIPDIADNCPSESNSQQRDTDRDSIGDVCDDCPYSYDPQQSNTAGSAFGDACNCALAGVLLSADGCPCVIGSHGEPGADAGDLCGLVVTEDGGIYDAGVEQ